jgi:cobalamin biosynthesis protein CobD/CbiB
MTWFSLCAALLLLHFFPFPGSAPLPSAYLQLAQWIETQFNAGESHSGAFAYALLLVIVLVPVALAYFLVASISGVLVWALNVAVLYASITFWRQLQLLGSVRTALQAGDAAAANTVIESWTGRSGLIADANQSARLGIEELVVEAHHGLLGAVFWFCLLPGPLGVVLYQATFVAKKSWQSDEAGGAFAWLARDAWWLLDWLPQRIAALSFAVVGNFEDALFCWRDQGARWNENDTGVLLSSAAGALGVKLGGPVAARDGVTLRPELGIGETADSGSMASAEGLLWRVVALWVAVLALAAIAL